MNGSLEVLGKNHDPETICCGRWPKWLTSGSYTLVHLTDDSCPGRDEADRQWHKTASCYSECHTIESVWFICGRHFWWHIFEQWVTLVTENMVSKILDNGGLPHQKKSILEISSSITVLVRTVQYMCRRGWLTQSILSSYLCLGDLTFT